MLDRGTLPTNCTFQIIVFCICFVPVYDFENYGQFDYAVHFDAPGAPDAPLFWYLLHASSSDKRPWNIYSKRMKQSDGLQNDTFASVATTYGRINCYPEIHFRISKYSSSQRASKTLTVSGRLIESIGSHYCKGKKVSYSQNRLNGLMLLTSSTPSQT